MSEPRTFPDYEGEPFPPLLHPFNPKHYWILFCWVLFRPSRLIYYLRQVDSELLYQLGRSVFKAFHYPAYRRLYVVGVGLCLILSLMVSSCLYLLSFIPVAWWAVWLGALLAVAGGVFGVLAAGAIFGVGFGTIFGITFAVLSSLVLPLFGGVWGGLAGWVTGAIAIAATGAIVAGMAYSADGLFLVCTAGVVFAAVAGTVQSGIITGITLSLMLFVVSVRFPIYLFELSLVLIDRKSRDEAHRVLARHPAMWDECLVLPLPGIVPLLEASLRDSLSEGMRNVLSIARNPLKRWASQKSLVQFILNYDDPLYVIYYIASCQELSSYIYLPHSKLMRDFIPAARGVILGEIGLQFASGAGDFRNTGERAAWRVTRRLRWNFSSPLLDFSALLYHLYRAESSIEARSGRYNPSDIVGVFRELRATGPVQGNKQNAGTKPGSLVASLEFDWSRLRSVPYKAEIAGSFDLIDKSLKDQNISDIAGAKPRFDWLVGLDVPLRPSIVESCRALADVSTQVDVAERATNLNRQEAALNLAAGSLQELLGYVEVNVKTPERVLLKRVIQHWQSIVAQAQGQLGATALRQMSPQLRQASGLDVQRHSTVWQRPISPLANPYVVGNPVTGLLFVGRAAIFNRISEVWSAKAHPDSIILYGHRRMGKSSLLRNLDQAARSDTVIVYVDLAGETSFVESTADLLLGLANKVHAAVRRAYPTATLTPPDSAAYTSAGRAQIEFDRLTEQVRDVLQTRSVILALDEFEAVEKAIGAGRIDAGIYQFLRTKTQDPLFTFVLGGLHTLDEMSRDYQQPFYGSYENIRVSYLSHDEAWQLITNPTPDFELDYEPAAVERIITETGGQPYLVQQICRDAIEHLNHEVFDEHLTRDVLITLADVGAVLDRDFFTRGTVYFDGVWSQTTNDDQRSVLRVLAQQEEPWTRAEVQTATSLTVDAVRAALRWAAKHDILSSDPDGASGWQYCVPLMRRWVSEKQ